MNNEKDLSTPFTWNDSTWNLLGTTLIHSLRLCNLPRWSRTSDSYIHVSSLAYISKMFTSSSPLTLNYTQEKQQHALHQALLYKRMSSSWRLSLSNEGLVGVRRQAVIYLREELLAILQPSVGRFGLAIGSALPELSLLYGQGSVLHGLDPLRLGWGQRNILQWNISQEPQVPISSKRHHVH